MTETNQGWAVVPGLGQKSAGRAGPGQNFAGLSRMARDLHVSQMLKKKFQIINFKMLSG